MKNFKDLGVTHTPADGKKRFKGATISIRELVNLPIVVHDFETGIKTEQGEDRCLVQIEMNGEMRKFFTNSGRDEEHPSADTRNAGRLPFRDDHQGGAVRQEQDQIRIYMRIQGSAGVAPIECVNPRKDKWRVRWDIEEQDGMATYEEAEFDRRPTLDEIKAAVLASYNTRIDEAIRSGIPLGRDARVALGGESVQLQGRVRSGRSDRRREPSGRIQARNR